jgi:Nuclease-related domain/UvrD-like helicase C-terminal domain
MPVCVPERPRFTSASERQVWKLLRQQLRPHDVLYANLRITDDLMDHEADLVVVLPGAGLVVVEIKGGEVWHDGQSWWQRRAGPVRIHPVDQARDTKYAQMAELAVALPSAQRYDSVVVDEAQDFAESWWPALLAALRDDEHGGMYVFTDDGQRVFPRNGRPPVSLVPLVLDHNLRNARQIADTFMPLTPMPMQLLGGDGPAVRLVACATADAVGRADDEVDALLADGWRPQDVALLTTGSRHPEQMARQAAGQDAYWRTFWDDDQVFYGHVLGFKGMERRAVVLTLNESRPRERSRERLYVGLSRARDQLVVVGDPDYIRAVGGEDVLAGIRRTGND